LLISTIRIVDINNLDHTSDTKYMSTVYGLLLNVLRCAACNHVNKIVNNS